MKNFPSIKKNEDFRLVYKKGKSCACTELVMYVMPNGSEENRIGISASKKLGNSITRHRMTRLCREAFRLENPGLLQGYDIVVIVREAALGKKFSCISDAFEKLCKRHNLK